MTATPFHRGIIGMGDAKEALQRMIDRDRVPNGILIHGAEGRGKRTLAIAFAGALLGRPLAAARIDDAEDLGHPDLVVVERDPEQRQVGIDRIRRLKDAFSLSPVEARGRVALLVDAERLTVEAGNALLKILEEPPPNAHLVLTARDRDAVMETLVSRSRTLRAAPATDEEVEAFLVARGVERERARELALLCEGSPGTALRFSSEDVFESEVRAPLRLLLGVADPEGAAESLSALVRGGASTRLEVVRERLRLALDGLVRFLRLALRQAAGREEAGRRLIVHLPEFAALLPSPRVEDVERLMAAVLESRADLDRNLTPDLVTGNLVRSLRRALPHAFVSRRQHDRPGGA